MYIILCKYEKILVWQSQRYTAKFSGYMVKCSFLEVSNSQAGMSIVIIMKQEHSSGLQ